MIFMGKYMNNNIFREYDIRGIVDKELSIDLANKIGKAFGTIDQNTEELNITPIDDFNGAISVTIKVYDDDVGNLEGTDSFTLTVNPVNDSPKIVSIDGEDVEVNLDITVNTDEDIVLTIPIISCK